MIRESFCQCPLEGRSSTPCRQSATRSMRMAKMMKKELEGGWGEGTVGKEMQGGDCWERDARRGLLGKRCKEGTVGKEMQGGDCGERDARRGLLGKRCKEGTVVKEKQGGDCWERDARRGLW